MSQGKCDATVTIDFDSVDCDLQIGHPGFHVMNAESGRIKWIPEHTGSTGYMSPRETWPDDTEADECIASSESLAEALLEIADKYDVPLTANYPRWQEGRFARSDFDFVSEIIAAFKRFPEGAST